MAAQQRQHNSADTDAIPLSDAARELRYFEVGLCCVSGLLRLRPRCVISFQPITEKTASLRRIRHCNQIGCLVQLLCIIVHRSQRGFESSIVTTAEVPE